MGRRSVLQRWGGVPPTKVDNKGGVVNNRASRNRPKFTDIEEYTVANSPQARKRARQGEKRRTHNASLRSLVRTVIKKVNAAVESGDAEAAKAAYADAVPVIDRMADKGIIHKNKAARHKSRLNAQVKALAA